MAGVNWPRRHQAMLKIHRGNDVEMYLLARRLKISQLNYQYSLKISALKKNGAEKRKSGSDGENENKTESVARRK
jgi:hypothetical protein